MNSQLTLEAPALALSRLEIQIFIALHVQTINGDGKTVASKKPIIRIKSNN